MKRQFNLFDALFIVALVFKLKNWPPVPAWWEVFCPYMIEAVIALITLAMAFYGVTDSIKQWLVNKAIAWRVRRSAVKAKKFVKGEFEKGKASANPGRAVDKIKQP